MQVIARVFFLVIVSALTLVACSSAGVNDSVTSKPNVNKNLPASEVTPDDHIDGFFVVPELDFSRYRKMIVRELQLDDITVRQPTSMSKSKSWVLTDNQKRNFRESYIGAVVGHMIADGVYSTAIDTGDDVLSLQAAIVQIVPFSSSNNSGATPTMIRPEAEAMVTITIEMYDSQTNQLLATLTDSYNFGRLWEENSQLVNTAPTHNAFDFWLSYLRQELDVLSRRR
jgi:hypothetical protein